MFFLVSATVSPSPPGFSTAASSPKTRAVIIFRLISSHWSSPAPSFFTANVPLVPGHPANPRTLFLSVVAFSVLNRKLPSSGETFAAWLGSPYSLCGVARSKQASPLKTEGNTSSNAAAPVWNSSTNNTSCFSDPSNTRSTRRTTGPASISSTVYATVTPVTSAPTSSARCTGAAPRNCGSSDGWMFSVPSLGMARNFCGSQLPYAAVTAKSGCSALNASRNAGSFAFVGHNTRSAGTPRRSAVTATGEGGGGPDLCRPRPRGRPGWLTTA
mmetsp:Transcript_1500/g.5098  ORF Transcript_1500/g.5098 Transcript_1500/m.5098 type:complete len:271 (-) Transcript_1500:417-1229(-)